MTERGSALSSRRRFLKLAVGLSAAVPVLAACASTPATPTVPPAPTTRSVATPAPAATSAPAGAPSQAAAPSSAKGSGTMTLGYAQKSSYDHFMHMRHDAGGTTLYDRTFVEGKLVTRSHDHTSYIGDLAEKWDFSADGKTLTFNLRKGLTWQDGQPFTANDVSFTYHFIGLPGLGGAQFGSWLSPYIAGMKEFMDGKADKVSGIQVKDDYTISFGLLNTFNTDVLFSNFDAVCIAPQHLLMSYFTRDKAKDILQSDWATTAKHVGIGPFKVTDYVADQYAIMDPFSAYYRGKPKLSKLVYRPFADSQTLNAALEKQEVDVGRLDPSEYARFKKLDYLTFVEAKPPTYMGTPFNTRQPYLNKQVRQALMYAIDREAIAKNLYAGAVDVIHSNISVPKYGDSPNLLKYEYNPDKAKQLLKDGNWDLNRKIRWAVSAVPSDESYYAAINGYWAKVGVQAEYQVFGQDATKLWAPGWDFDLYPSAYPIGHPVEIATHFDPRLATYVSAGYDAPGFTDLWDRSMLQGSDDEIKKAIWSLQETIAEQALGLMTVRTADIWVINKRIHNIQPMYMGYEYFSYDWQPENITAD